MTEQDSGKRKITIEVKIFVKTVVDKKSRSRKRVLEMRSPREAISIERTVASSREITTPVNLVVSLNISSQRTKRKITTKILVEKAQ